MQRRNYAILAIVGLLLASQAWAQRAASSSKARPDKGSVRGSTYKNDFFSFTYTFPKGWSVLNEQSQTRIRLTQGPLYTLLLATASPSSGTISPSNAGIVVLAEDVSQTGIHDAKEAATKLADILTRTEPPHTILNPPRELSLDGVQFVRLDYEQQTFPQTRHYFCSAISMLKGYTVRVSVIADSKNHMDEICGTIESIRFERK